MSRVQQVVDSAPAWVQWVGIVGTAALSWIQPVAGIVAIVWGCMQIWAGCKKKWYTGSRDRRKQERLL